ncbi:MAG: hypothetical protein AB8G11_09695 [Saprospiraceae bacterium]
MTISEAKDILVKRLGWRNDKTVDGFVVSTDNLVSESGRFFQDEHSAITLNNIRDCQPLLNISEYDFNDYLQRLKTQIAFQVLSAVFEKDTVNDRLFDLYGSGFDNLLSLRMVIVVSELMMTTTRYNVTERFTEDFVGKLNYDIFREAPNKFAIRGANYSHTLGIATRYDFELKSVQRRFGSQRNILRTITKGEVYNEFYDNINGWNRYNN